MSAKDAGVELDFTGIFVVKALTQTAPPLPAKIPEEIVIGAKALKKGGYFIQITNPRPGRAVRAGSKTVLIIEDEPSTLLLLDHLLRKAGYVTRKAVNGASFVAAIKLPPLPDLVLLDLELPDISGLRILVKLREHPQTKTLPVLVLSARSELKDVYQCLSLGADGYVTKPTKAGPLLQAVKAILGA